MSRRRDRPLWLVLRVAGGVGGVLLGAGLVLLTLAVGSCGSFGGTCPSPEGLRGDVYGTVAAGFLVAVAAPVLAWRPDRAGLAVAAAAAVPITVVGTFVLGRLATT